MGYTHYWRTDERADPILWDKGIAACRRICEASREILAADGHDALSFEHGIRCNGIPPDDDHETFILHAAPDEDTDFCKTAAKPYDVVVTACLAVMAYHVSAGFVVSSDGGPSDWDKGVALARRVLGDDTIHCPLRVGPEE